MAEVTEMVDDFIPNKTLKCIYLTDEQCADLKTIMDAYDYDERKILDTIVQEGIANLMIPINNAIAYRKECEEQEAPDYSIPPWDRD